MKQTFTTYYSIIYVCALFLLAACQSSELMEEAGGFSVSLQEDTALLTRSTPAELGKPIATQFNLTISRAGSGETVYSGLLPEGTVRTRPGDYRLTASFGSNEPLAIDAPYYEGNANATVLSGETTSVILPCKVANALISVRYKEIERFQKYYSSFGVRVTAGSQSLTLADEERKQSAYLSAGTSNVSLQFVGTLRKDGTEVSVELTAPNLPTTYQAAHHTILTLEAELKPAAGAEIVVEKVETTPVSITTNFPIEWLPAPKISGFEQLDYVETEEAPKEALIQFTASSPVQEIEVEVDGNSYNANQSDELAEMGILLSGLNEKAGAVDLRQYIEQLQYTPHAEEALKNVKVKVKANNREQISTHRIQVLQPEFQLTVPEGSCWTKQFGVDFQVTKGNAERIKNNLVFLYSADGGNSWTSTEERWDESQQAVVFDQVPEQKQYQVKAVYRNAITSNTADATLETAAQIPNSDMESWHTKKVGRTGIFGGNKDYYDFLPYAEGDTDIWWTTNSARARDYQVSPVWVTASACVSYSETVAHSGSRSALIYTSGHGGNYTSSAISIYPDGAFAGSLFIGTYLWKRPNEVITQGHPFTTRPTHFEFWYKYEPKLNTSDQIKAYIELKNGEETIATGTFIPEVQSEADADFKKATIELAYTRTDLKATSVFVQFLSTTKTSFVRNDFEMNKKITFPVMGEWSAHIGSILYVDDISLIYNK